MLGNNSDERKRKMSRENAKTSLQNDTFIYVKKLKNIKKTDFFTYFVVMLLPNK